MKLNYFEVQHNNDLRVVLGPFRPDDDRLVEIVPETDKVTGFRFSYSDNEDNKTDYVKMVFVGKVLGFEDVKHLFYPQCHEIYKDRKIAVSFDSDGSIKDVRPIINDIDEAVPVADRDELLKAYKAETGYDFAPSSKKR